MAGQKTKRPGRPPTRNDPPIKVPLPFDELVGDILKTGSHPMERKASKKPNKGRLSGN